MSYVCAHSSVLILYGFLPVINGLYSCQNKRQNALFWARKLKKISWGGGTAPSPTPIGEGTPPPQTSPLGACGASPHICQPLPQLFFHNSHTGRSVKSILLTVNSVLKLVTIVLHILLNKVRLVDDITDDTVIERPTTTTTFLCSLVRTRAGFRGGPMVPQASHQKGASHQTLQFLFRAHYMVN